MKFPYIPLPGIGFSFQRSYLNRNCLVDGHGVPYCCDFAFSAPSLHDVFVHTCSRTTALADNMEDPLPSNQIIK